MCWKESILYINKDVSNKTLITKRLKCANLFQLLRLYVTGSDDIDIDFEPYIDYWGSQENFDLYLSWIFSSFSLICSLYHFSRLKVWVYWFSFNYTITTKKSVSEDLNFVPIIKAVQNLALSIKNSYLPPIYFFLNFFHCNLKLYHS